MLDFLVLIFVCSFASLVLCNILVDPIIARKVDCGNPQPPANGSVHYTGLKEGSKAVIECSAGFQILGRPIAECNSNGSWEPDTAKQQCIHDLTAGKNLCSV